MSRKSVSLAVACLLGTIPTLTPLDEVHAADARAEAGIEAQPLAGALKEFAARTGLQVVYGSELARGMISNGAPGGLPVDETLRALLQGTGLEFEFVAERTVAIREKREKQTAQGLGNGTVRLAQAVPASAQSANRQSGAANPVVDSRIGQLEEIVVTAQKRSQNIQNVPMSITAITAGDIDRRGAVSAEDYLRGVPGVNQSVSQVSQSIVIRGIETSTSAQNFASGPTVATFFGEVSTTNSAGLAGESNVDIKLVDIERVEVLRGPQGTAFGSSSLGGAVRTIAVAPKLGSVEGSVAASFSATSGTGGSNDMQQVVLNVPVVADSLAVRLVGYQFRNSGFYRNRAGSDANFLASVASYGAQGFARSSQDIGASDFTGGRASALWKVSDNLNVTLNYITQKTQVDGQAYANAGIYDKVQLDLAPEHVVRGQRDGVADTDIDIWNAVAEYDLGWGTMLGTVSHIDSGTTYAVPAFFNDTTQPWSQLATSNHREKSGEVRLATKLDGAWNFLAGLYAERHEDTANFNYLWYGAPAANIIAPGAGRYLGDYWDARTLDQKAAFGEVSWQIVEGWTLTGGARSYKYDRTARTDTDGPYFRGTPPTTIRAADASGTNFRANLSYEPNDQTLLYTGWSQGFRLGKPQAGLPSGQCDTNGDGVVDGTGVTIEETTRLASDSIDNMELGAKWTLLDRRLQLSAAVFRLEWTGVPVRVPPLNNPGCTQTYIANAGEALSDGVEFQASFAVTDQLRVDLGGSKVNARLSKDAPALRAREGARLPGSPKVNANLALTYDFALGEYDASIRSDAIYVGTLYGDLLSSPNTKAGGYVAANASMRLKIRALDIDLFVRNVGDADDFSFRGALPRGPLFGFRLRPRTVGLQLKYQF